jgi:orotate phosphoribosyltransferase
VEKKTAAEILQDVGAVITNSHFVYTSWKHGSAYVNKDALYPHTMETSALCLAIAREFVHEQVEAVVVPAVGGVALSQWTAYHLSYLTGREVLAIYAEKSDDGNSFVIKRGYDKLIAKKEVLVVEDILNTGGTARKVVEAVRAIKGKVIGVGCLCNRGGVTYRDLSYVRMLHSLVNIKLDAWDEADCPLCAQGVPVNTDVGKGREFLERKQKQ